MTTASHMGLDFCDLGIGGVYLPEGAGVALACVALPWVALVVEPAFRSDLAIGGTLATAGRRRGGQR